MDSSYPDRRRPSRETIVRGGYGDDDITIPHRNAWQPAKKLQETRALLASPGPLESMLKTTTETGDIGIYSIRASRSSSHSRAPLQPRSNSAGNVLARTMSVNAAESRSFRDDRRGLPSYRDTTSEIISLYGQRSNHGHYSRSPEDPGPRSYSLTSCSSRYPSDQKSTGTWDSRSSGGSGGVLARPRSPYPYPTRLKRPGVRPSSPALAMDGSVDYSRMVEVDRPSYVRFSPSPIPQRRTNRDQRTVHRTYNRSYHPNPPRQPYPFPRQRPYVEGYIPRSPPGDAEAFALSRQGSFATRTHPVWPSRPRDQPESSSSDQSGGVSSITSIVRMYESPSPQPTVHQSPIPQNGSFYYDYSEDFQSPTITAPCEPVSPMPRRAPSMTRPMVLDDRPEPTASANAATEDTVADPGSPASRPLSARCSEPRDLPPKPQGSSEEALRAGSVEITPQDETLIGDQIEETAQDATSGNAEFGSSPMVTENSPASAIDATKPRGNFDLASEAPDAAEVKNKEHPIVGDDKSITLSNTESEPRLVSKHSEAGCSSAGATVEDMTPGTPSANAVSPGSRGSESTKRDSEMLATPSETTRRRSNVYSLQPGLLDLKTFVQDLDDAGLLHDANVSNSGFRGSNLTNTPVKANQGSDVHAVLARTNKLLEAEADRITSYRDAGKPALPSAISRLKTGIISDRRQSADDTKSVILAPQPVSPARQLKLRRSVSKLMKALPPLPDAPDGPESQATSSPFTERRLPDTPSVPRLSLSGGPGPALFTQVPANASSMKNPAVGAPNAASTDISHATPSPDMYGDIWDVHFRKSNDQATTGAGMQSASAIPLPRVDRTDENMRTNHDGSTSHYPGEPHPLSQRGKFKSSTMRSKPANGGRLAHLNSIAQARGTSLDTSRSILQAPPVPSKDLICIQPVTLAGNDTRPPRGLRKRLSDLKIRLTESRHRAADWSSSDVHVHENGEIIGVAVPVTSSTGSPESGGHTLNSNSATEDAPARGLRYKISRWMKSAKNAVNTCKRLSSSTTGTSLDTDF